MYLACLVTVRSGADHSVVEEWVSSGTNEDNEFAHLYVELSAVTSEALGSVSGFHLNK